MLKRTVVAAMLGATLMVPVASAQGTTSTAGKSPVERQAKREAKADVKARKSIKSDRTNRRHTGRRARARKRAVRKMIKRALKGKPIKRIK